MWGVRRSLRPPRTPSPRPAEAGSLTSLYRKKHGITSTRRAKRHRCRSDVRLRRIGRKRSPSNLLFTDGRKTRFVGHHRITPVLRAFCEIRMAGFNGDPSSMQRQTTEEAKPKDRWE